LIKRMVLKTKGRKVVLRFWKEKKSQPVNQRYEVRRFCAHRYQNATRTTRLTRAVRTNELPATLLQPIFQFEEQKQNSSLFIRTDGRLMNVRDRTWGCGCIFLKGWRLWPCTWVAGSTRKRARPSSERCSSPDNPCCISQPLLCSSLFVC
jgi:hypothetical protein